MTGLQERISEIQSDLIGITQALYALSILMDKAGDTSDETAAYGAGELIRLVGIASDATLLKVEHVGSELIEKEQGADHASRQTG